MEYRTDDRPAVRVIHFEGDIAKADDQDLKRLFVNLKQDGATRVVFDLGKVTFLDSVVLGTLVWGLKNLREAGGDLRLCGLQGFVLRLFEMTELVKAFRVFDDCHDAAESFT